MRDLISHVPDGEHGCIGNHDVLFDGEFPPTIGRLQALIREILDFVHASHEESILTFTKAIHLLVSLVVPHHGHIVMDDDDPSEDRDDDGEDEQNEGQGEVHGSTDYLDQFHGHTEESCTHKGCHDIADEPETDGIFLFEHDLRVPLCLL